MQEKWETQVWSLSWEDPLEKEMTTHYSILAWKIPWAEKPCRLQSMGSQRVGQNWAHYYNIKIWSKLYILWSIGKDSDAGRDWGQEEKGTTEDEMTGWHHRLDGRESELTQGVGDGQGGLACRNSWGRKSQTRLSDWTELNWYTSWVRAFNKYMHPYNLSLSQDKKHFHEVSSQSIPTPAERQPLFWFLFTIG